jgi:chromate reductase, NAD(P)H dehydrogenase (quinone)
MTARILAFAGSLRRESVNKKLEQIAVKGAKEAGAEVTLQHSARRSPRS